MGMFRMDPKRILKASDEFYKNAKSLGSATDVANKEFTLPEGVIATGWIPQPTTPAARESQVAFEVLWTKMYDELSQIAVVLHTISTRLHNLAVDAKGADHL